MSLDDRSQQSNLSVRMCWANDEEVSLLRQRMKAFMNQKMIRTFFHCLEGMMKTCRRECQVEYGGLQSIIKSTKSVVDSVENSNCCPKSLFTFY
jgi:hypothetical protein